MSLRDTMKKITYAHFYGRGPAKLKNITADSNDEYYRHDDELCSCREWVDYTTQQSRMFYNFGTPKLGPPKEDCENCEGYGTKPIPFVELL